MNRLVSTLLLAAFAAQHFMCCCSGLGTHACDQVSSVAASACKIATGDDHCSADSSCNDEACCESHDEPCGGIHPDEDDCPCGGSHGHHLCVVSHLFFTATPRASLPPAVGWHHFDVWAAEASLLMRSASLTCEIHDGVDFGPPLTAQARRSALCVYRI